MYPSLEEEARPLEEEARPLEEEARPLREVAPYHRGFRQRFRLRQVLRTMRRHEVVRLRPRLLGAAVPVAVEAEVATSLPARG